MTHYVQFLVVNNGHLCNLLGSDGVFILDGRNTLLTMKVDAMMRKHRLRKVQPHIVGYKIIKGNRFDDDNPVLHTWICPGTHYTNKDINPCHEPQFRIAKFSEIANNKTLSLCAKDYLGNKQHKG